MGAWIEIPVAHWATIFLVRRPRMGAWIEIPFTSFLIGAISVAPVWGRGLKYLSLVNIKNLVCRPRMGAWIEIRR